MKSKGFTLVEVLAVITIVAILGAVSVPMFVKIKNNVLESQYKNVKLKIETAAEKFASDTKIITVSVEDLIKSGYLQADDEDNIYNPIDNSSLNCKIVETTVSDDGYSSKLTDNGSEVNGKCSEYTRNVDTLINVECVDDKCSNAQKNTSGEWYSGTLKLSAKNDGNKKISTYRWLSLTGDSSDEEMISVTTDSLKNTSYTLALTYEDGTTSEGSIDLKIDNEKPTIIDIVKDDNWTALKKDVTINANDGMGSQIQSYYIGEDNTCSGDYQESNKFSLNAGKYYACVKDKAGNVSDHLEVLIENVDSTKPVAVSQNGSYFETYSSTFGVSYYSELTRKITFQDDESKVSRVKYCFTNKETCEPNKNVAVKQQSVSEALIPYEANKKETRVCVEAYDGVGNKSEVYCDDTFLVDTTKPTNINVSQDKNKSNYVNVSSEDKESNINKMICKFGESSKNLDKEVESKDGSCNLGVLESNKTYYVQVDAYNNANLVASSDITSFKAEVSIEDAYREICKDEEYCSNPLYVKYNNNLFVVYRNNNGYKAIYYSVNGYGVFTHNECCNSGHCTYANSEFTVGEIGDYLNRIFLAKLPSYQNKIKNYKWNTGDETLVTRRKTSAYVGLLDYEEYQNTRDKSWVYEGAKNYYFWLGTPVKNSSADKRGKTYQQIHTIMYSNNLFYEEPMYVNWSTASANAYGHVGNAYYRPVVVFQKNIKFVKGNGSFDNPYVV